MSPYVLMLVLWFIHCLGIVTEIPSTRVSASEVDGLGCSSGYGAQPVGLSWLPGGTHNAALATDGHLA